MNREDKISNDLFYVCSLIEQIGRLTKNKRIDIVNFIGEKELSKIFRLADVYHCEPIENTADEMITRFRIADGIFDNVSQCRYFVPTVFDIGKVYKRLVLYVACSRNITHIKALIDVYSAPVAVKIDDYNSSVYYENSQYLEKFYDLNNPPEVIEFYG